MQSGSVRVGIVDDSEDLRFVLRLTLEADGRFDVAGEACDGEEALGMVETVHPDLLVLDLAMPGMDGMTALRRLRQSPGGDDPVVVVLSAYPVGGYATDAIAAGANHYVQKGGDPSVLADSLWCAWERAGRAGPAEPRLGDPRLQ